MSEPLDLKEAEIRKAFEQWYFSKDLIPHGVMFTNLAYQGFKAGIEYIKERIEAACEFYLRYKDDPLLLVRDWDDSWDTGFEDVFEFIDEFSYWVGKDKKAWKRKKYNEWLFKLAFRGILKEVRKDEGNR